MSLTIRCAEFIRRKMDQTPPDLLINMDKTVIERNLTMVYDQIYDRNSNLEFAKSFQKKCPVPNLHYSQYLDQEILISNIRLIVGLRFRDTKVNDPFIDILFYDSDIEVLMNHLKEIKTTIIQHYSPLAPRWIRFEIYTEKRNLISLKPYTFDLHLVGKELKLEEQTIDSKELFIEKIESWSLEDQEIYSMEYAIFNQKNPSLDFVRAEPFDSIQSALKKWVFVPNSFTQ